MSSMFAFVGSGRGALQQLAQISTLAVSFAVVLAGSLYAGGAWVLAILAGTGVLALLFRPLSHAAHSAGDRTRMATRGFSTALNQLLSTSLEIRIFGVEQRAAESADELADELGASNARQNLVKGRLNSLYSSAVYLLAVGGLGALTIAEVSDPARYAAVVLLLFRGMGYGRGLQSAYQNLLSLLPGIEDLEESRRELHGARVREGGRAIPAGFHSLRLDDVSFSYTADAPALESVSLELVAGQAVGLVGPSGSGKSTLVSLLLGLRSPSSGRVLVDGHDLAEADMRSWYGRAVLVPQEPHILQETIAENVRCYREDVTDDQIERALRQAHAYEEFLALPNGIDTEIGEYGVRLSGGQRQRLALARALAGQPELLILDEPTSALDALSEEAIRVSLEEIRGSVTLVVIAHRLSTLRICDSIVVMEKGRLSGIGSRESIERDSEFFAEAVRLARTV